MKLRTFEIREISPTKFQVVVMNGCSHVDVYSFKDKDTAERRAPNLVDDECSVCVNLEPNETYDL